jgi:signal transduction histidine kinase
MDQLKTLRVRFALWTAGLLLISLVLFGLFVYVNMSRSLSTVVDETLHLTGIQLLMEIEMSDGELIVTENPIEDVEYAQLRERGLSMRVLNVAGQLVEEYGPYTNLPLPQIDFITLDQPGEFATSAIPDTQDPVRIYTVPIVDQNELVGVLQVAQNLGNVRDTLNLLLISLLIGGPLIVFVAGSGGYFLAVRALAPIDKITRTARYISANDLSTRLNLPETQDEVGRLAATFDLMLARLDEAFQRERQFTADASHELGTPLSAMQTIIGSTLARQRTRVVYEQALIDLGQEAEQMRALTEGLLHLARNDAALHARFEHINLSLLLEDVADSFRPLAEGKGLELINKVADEGLTLIGDRDGLIRLFVNLLDNAIKYTEQGFITISTQRQDDNLLVTISDTGVAIAPEHLPYIFDRFYRVDESRSTEGIGLGLAIALDIARAHGGNIVVDSTVGKGTVFNVQLARKVEDKSK